MGQEIPISVKQCVVIFKTLQICIFCQKHRVLLKKAFKKTTQKQSKQNGEIQARIPITEMRICVTVLYWKQFTASTEGHHFIWSWN